MFKVLLWLWNRLLSAKQLVTKLISYVVVEKKADWKYNIAKYGITQVKYKFLKTVLKYNTWVNVLQFDYNYWFIYVYISLMLQLVLILITLIHWLEAWFTIILSFISWFMFFSISDSICRVTSN